VTVAAAGGIEDLGRTVMRRVSIPKDRWEIAAQLEVLGFRDGDARERFGCHDLFDLADRLLRLFHEGRLEFVVEKEDARRRAVPLLRFFRHYFDGLTFSLPMVLQGATMLLFGYGLWGAMNLDARTGSAIAIGFIASYVAANGFSWSIVSRGLFYQYQKEGSLARWSALRMWWLAMRVTIALALPALLFNAVYRLLPFDMALVAGAYYAALVIFWLNWALIYLVGQTHWLLAALGVSISVVVAAARGLGWPVVGANLLGIAVADVLTFGIALATLNRWARNGSGKPAVNPPRLTVLIYTTAPVFLYGFLYSAFMFTDRVLAWTATRGREDFPPYVFWLNARYELGMDLALIVVVLLAGVLEYSVHEFSSRLIPGQKRVKSSRIDPFLNEFRRFYSRRSGLLFGFSILALAVAAFTLSALSRFPDERLQESLAAPATLLVFWVAAVSYAIFMFAMQNVLMLMTLSRTDLAVRAMAVALAFNIAAGFILSRGVHYSCSVFGLLAGSVVLAVLAHRSVREALGELDYYYYAAY
jgi:hypothetical protein